MAPVRPVLEPPAPEPNAPKGIHAETIRRLVLGSLPAGPGHRNRQVFDLARALRALPTLSDAAVEDLDILRPSVLLWHNEGVRRELIRTEPFEETWIDFLRAWPKIRFPQGAEPMTAILQRARQAPPPPAAARYEQAGLRLLVALCRELQRAAGEEPFFLACRTAGRLLDVSHVQASRWLFLLAHNRAIELVERSQQGHRRANRYRYLADPNT
ncbi:MAG: hypothetical protein JW809_20250 [Pirellulales bacterium]|nr:hypothetical protein [Pirellulales bacterium]